MTKEELAVATTFLVAEVPKEIACAEQGEIYADYAFLFLPLEDAKLNNRADTGESIAQKVKADLDLGPATFYNYLLHDLTKNR